MQGVKKGRRCSQRFQPSAAPDEISDKSASSAQLPDTENASFGLMVSVPERMHRSSPRFHDTASSSNYATADDTVLPSSSGTSWSDTAFVQSPEMSLCTPEQVRFAHQGDDSLLATPVEVAPAVFAFTKTRSDEEFGRSPVHIHDVLPRLKSPMEAIEENEDSVDQCSLEMESDKVGVSGEKISLNTGVLEQESEALIHDDAPVRSDIGCEIAGTVPNTAVSVVDVPCVTVHAVPVESDASSSIVTLEARSDSNAMSVSNVGAEVEQSGGAKVTAIAKDSRKKRPKLKAVRKRRSRQTRCSASNIVDASVTESNNSNCVETEISASDSMDSEHFTAGTGRETPEGFNVSSPLSSGVELKTEQNTHAEVERQKTCEMVKFHTVHEHLTSVDETKETGPPSEEGIAAEWFDVKDGADTADSASSVDDGKVHRDVSADSVLKTRRQRLSAVSSGSQKPPAKNKTRRRSAAVVPELDTVAESETEGTMFPRSDFKSNTDTVSGTPDTNNLGHCGSKPCTDEHSAVECVEESGAVSSEIHLLEARESSTQQTSTVQSEFNSKTDPFSSQAHTLISDSAECLAEEKLLAGLNEKDKAEAKDIFENLDLDHIQDEPEPAPKPKRKKKRRMSADLEIVMENDRVSPEEEGDGDGGIGQGRTRRSSLRLYRRQSRKFAIPCLSEGGEDRDGDVQPGEHSVAVANGEEKVPNPESACDVTATQSLPPHSEIPSTSTEVPQELQDLYKNKNYKAPPEKTWETIFEVPSKGKATSKQKLKRYLQFEDNVPAAKLRRRLKRAAQNGWDANLKIREERFTEFDVMTKMKELDEEVTDC
jgi:hypothetical protein